MRVALPLLTLVPGISGGSETYARELCRALARIGEHDYEALSLALASEPGRMAALRTKLEANRLTKPLFDTTRYVRNLEAALVQAHECRVQGLAA